MLYQNIHGKLEASSVDAGINFLGTLADNTFPLMVG
jgi:hypothetical protein